jgi:two-component system, response regulator YesN
MFNVIIVDDKKSIREGLKQFIDWKELGFNVIGDFPSAAEAIKFIESECVDVLLTDIVMPDVNGLELIREVKLINPEIKVIILSAYEKFEYAQEAVRLGAFYYLTKPVNIEKLKTEFANLYAILQKEKLSRHHKKEFSTFAAEQFFNNLVNNHYNSIETIFKRANEINLHFKDSNYSVLRVALEKKSYSGKVLDEGSFQLLKSMAASHISGFLNNLGMAYVFSSSLTEISILFFPNTAELIKSYIEQLRDDVKDSLNFDVFIGVGKVYDNIYQASNSFTEAGKALEYRIIKRNSNVLFYEDISKFFKGKSLITPEIEEAILNYLSLQDKSSLKEYISDIMSNSYSVGQNNTNILYDACIELLLIINKYLTSNVDNKKSIEQNDYFSIKSLLQKQNFEEISNFMLDYLEDCFTIIRNNDEKSAGLIIENAKRYINEHYSEEITLNKLSEVVYVNPMYLSRLFKEKIGENFIDYLTRVRIEHAKRLLSDLSLRIYDITEMVGYESRKHFGKTFKEVTGFTPKEYRNSFTINKQ